MLNRNWVAFIVLVLVSLAGILYTTRDGNSEADMRYRECVEARCSALCPIKTRWEKLKCQSDCRLNCNENELPRNGTVIYYGKWPLRRATKYGKQAFASVVFSVLTFAMHIRGMSSLWILRYHKLPQPENNNKAFHEYTRLWLIYGLFSVNSWLWTAAFHARDIDLTEKLYYSSALALLGYSLVVAAIRILKLKKTVEVFVVAAPLIAFVTTHILYLKAYTLDYGWNTKVWLVLVVADLTIWGVWAGATEQYLRRKIWLVIAGGGVAMLLDIYDFPPYKGLVDAHFLRYASAIPLTSIWWKFIQDDAECLTMADLSREIDLEEILNPSVIDEVQPRRKRKQGKKRK